MSEFEILHADCREQLALFQPECVDAFVQDPPYGLSFMGKGWDHSVPGPDYFEAQLRVAKPGAHLVAFGGTRTYHRLACAIEDAGWELRDCLMWLYGTGFPKSADVSKGIDAHHFGVWLDTHGHREEYHRQLADAKARKATAAEVKALHRTWHEAAGAIDTEDARAHAGQGTALKPAWEPIVLARKPFKGTVAANVLAHGTGALNIDATRIAAPDAPEVATVAPNAKSRYVGVMNGGTISAPEPRTNSTSQAGRWPANLVLDPEAAAELDAQTGERKSGTQRAPLGTGGIWSGESNTPCGPQYGDTGGASRFFYCAKASKAEREAGLEDFTPQIVNDGRATPIDNAYQRGDTKRRNTHPTVKPIALMRWLCRLVTPPGGLVVDPFCGSGTTGCAAVAEGFDFLGIDLDAGHAALADARVRHWAAQ